MPTYNSGITRDGSNDPLVPTPVANQIIQELPTSSVVMRLARKVTMSSQTERMPVLSVLPQVYTVASDQTLKQTTYQDWDNVTLTAVECAALVPVPDAYLADSQISVWDEVRPRVVEAFGAYIDGLALFGVAPSGDTTPSGWSNPLATSIVASDNDFKEADANDLAQATTLMAEAVTRDGFATVNGFAAKPGIQWRLHGLRSATDKMPIYTTDLANGGGGGLYGYPLHEVNNGAWDNDFTFIGGDWSKAIVGVRQDITATMSDSAVISDGNGAIVLNAFQQDSTNFRFVMRLAWATANPITALNGNSATRFPFGAVVSQPT